MKNILLILIASIAILNAQESKEQSVKAPLIKTNAQKAATSEQQIAILKGQIEALKAQNQRLARLLDFMNSEQTHEEQLSQATINRVQAELGCRLDSNFICIEEKK